MPRTFLRVDTQVRNTDVYDDTIAPSLASFETNPANLETDLNNLRSAIKSLMGKTNWWDTATRDVETIQTDLADMEAKRVLFRANMLTDVAVSASQNWEVLSVAGTETPSEVAAVAVTQNGAVVAQSALSGAGFAAHELTELAGLDAMHPKNLCIVRDATTGDAILSASRDVFALLQYESTGVDGAAFNDTSAGNRVKLSFVRPTVGFDDLEACPVADIAGKTVNYSYVRRLNLDAIVEDAFLGDAGFIDQIAAVDVTLNNAIDNQSGVATADQNIDIKLGANNEWAWQDQVNADLLNVKEGSGGSNSAVTVGAATDLLDINAVDVDVASGVKVNSTGTQINVGVTAGQIDSAGALSLLSGGGADLAVRSALDLYLDDAHQTGSTWAQTAGIKLSGATAEWDTFETNFGEVSLLNAINQSFTSVGVVTKTCANVTSNTNADVDVGGVGGGANLDAQLHDMSGGVFVDDHDVYLNGQLLRSGADATANNDVYPGTSLANGQLKFEFKVKSNDVICVISRA